MVKSQTKQFFQFTPADIDIQPVRVLHLAQFKPQDNWLPLVNDLLANSVTEWIQPHSISLSLTSEQISFLFKQSLSPVKEIAMRGKVWAFVATIGVALEQQVKKHFDLQHLVEAVLLDAIGSVVVEAVCDKLQTHLVPKHSSERFSPGYCHWEMSAQTRLFHFLKPEEIGVKLLDSMLMQPLKSVSGIMVQASRELLRINRTDCEQCEAHDCRRRQAQYKAVVQNNKN